MKVVAVPQGQQHRSPRANGTNRSKASVALGTKPPKNSPGPVHRERRFGASILGATTTGAAAETDSFDRHNKGRGQLYGNCPRSRSSALDLAQPIHSLAHRARISGKLVLSSFIAGSARRACLSDNITSLCRQQSILPVAVERANQLATVQELVSLSHGISMIPEMAKRLDRSDRRVYRSFCNPRPTRTVVCVSSPYRFHSRLFGGVQQRLRLYATSSAKESATARQRSGRGLNGRK